MTAAETHAQTYAQASREFLLAARSRNAAIRTYAHPTHRGPDDGPLAVQVASLGDEHAPNVIMIVSGTHGVEGHAGSLCQVSLLRSDLVGLYGRSVRWILVHAINPYGFAHDRRVNEDNVDLNSNFRAAWDDNRKSPSYSECHDLYFSAGPALDEWKEALERLQRDAASREGYGFLKRACQGGQYDHPLGLYYGGRAPTWSNGVFRDICRHAFAATRAGAVLDLHTGLGKPGVGEVLFLSRSALEQARSIAPPVSFVGGGGTVQMKIEGPLLSAAQDAAGLKPVTCCALEFGTVSLEENVHSLLFENWTWRHLPSDHPLRAESTARLKAAYFVANEAWASAVAARCREVVEALAQGLLNRHE